MARFVIVDEVASTRGTLSELLHKLGHEVEAVAAVDDLDQLLGVPTAGVLLAGRGASWRGEQVLRQIRETNGALPVIWMGNLPTGFSGTPPDCVVARPPRPAAIKDAVAKVLGGADNGGAWESAAFLTKVDGPLESFPPIRVLALAQRVKASGELRIITDHGECFVSVDGGKIVHALGFVDLLHEMGLRNGPDQDMGSVVGSAIAQGKPPDEALKAVARGIGIRLAEMLNADGHVSFDPQAKPPAQPIPLPMGVTRLVSEGMRVARPAKVIIHEFERYHGGKLQLTVPNGVPMEQLGLDPVAFRLLRKAKKVPYLDRVMKADDESNVLAVDLLRGLGYLKLIPPVGGPPTPAPTPPPMDPEDEPTDELSIDETVDLPSLGEDDSASEPIEKKPSKPKKAEDPKLKAIRARRAELRKAAAVDILDLKSVDDLTPATIDKQFYAISQEFHPDRFVGESRQIRRVAEECFSLVNQAHSVLSEGPILEEAKARLSARAAGKPFVSKRDRTKAKVAFAKGEIHFRHKRYAEAYPDLAAAVRLDPENQRYQLCFLQAGYWTQRVQARALTEALDGMVEALIEEDENKHRRQVADLCAVIGEVWMKEGKEDRAFKYFDKAVRHNPQQTDAARRIRLRDARQPGGNLKSLSSKKKGSKPGALDSFTGFFKKK